jgi:hypothetical protein
MSDKSNEGRTLGFHPRNCDSILEEHNQKCSPALNPPALAKMVIASYQIDDIQEKHAPQVFFTISSHFRRYKPPIATTIKFSTSISTMKIYFYV